MDIIVLALLAMASVCLWTLRLTATTRGHRLLAPPLAAVEALVYVTAFARLLSDLGAIERKLAFGLGVAAGTHVAMIVADRVRPAPATVPTAPRPDEGHRRPWIRGRRGGPQLPDSTPRSRDRARGRG